MASSINSGVPNPVAPLLRQVRAASACAVPAMSICAQGTLSTNSARNSAAVIEPAFGPPMLVRSAISEPSVRRHWPVRVAMSTTASTPSSTASTRASAITSRPSASVFRTSTRFPPLMVRTSPSRVADPDGMLSVHISQPVTATGQESADNAVMAARITPAPDMSFFIWEWLASAGLRAMPPESYITLADQAEVGPRIAGSVADLHHRRRLFAAGVDPEQATASQLDQSRLIEDLDGQPGPVGHLTRYLSDPRGGEIARWSVREIPAQRCRFRDHPAHLGPGLSIADGLATDDKTDLVELDRVVRAAHVEVVSAEHRALDDGAGGRVHGDLTGVRQVNSHPAGVRQRAAEGRGSVPQLSRRHAGRVADSDRDMDHPLSAGKHEPLPGRAAEAARLEGGTVDAELGGDRTVGGKKECGRFGGSRCQFRADGDLEVSQTADGGGDIDIGMLHAHGSTIFIRRGNMA